MLEKCGHPDIYGLFNKYVDKMRGRALKMYFFVHAHGIKIVHAGGRWVKKWQNSVHVVVECPLIRIFNF